jgi:hypothetical protein
MSSYFIVHSPTGSTIRSPFASVTPRIVNMNIDSFCPEPATFGPRSMVLPCGFLRGRSVMRTACCVMIEFENPFDIWLPVSKYWESSATARCSEIGSTVSLKSNVGTPTSRLARTFFRSVSSFSSVACSCTLTVPLSFSVRRY